MTPTSVLEDITADGKTTERYATIKGLGKRACVRSKGSPKGSLLILQRDAKRLPSVREDSDQYSSGDCRVMWRAGHTQDLPEILHGTGYALPGKLTLRALAPLYVIPISDSPFMGISIVSGVRAAQFIPTEFARPASRSLEIFRFRVLYRLK